MKSGITISKTPFKVNVLNPYFNLLKHHITSIWFHLFYFTYRNKFFYPTYNLISSRVSELQLTYMDTVWDKLVPLNLRKEKSLKVKQNISSFKRLDLNLTKFTKNKIINLILRPRNFFITSYMQSRLPLKYLNSYYSFLYTRLGFNKRNYLQRFFHWYNLFIQTASTAPYFSVSRIKLKHLRRGKIRTLKKSQYNYKTTVYSPYTSSIYKFSNSSFIYPIKTLKIKLNYYTKLLSTKSKLLYASTKVNTKRRSKYLIRLRALNFKEFNSPLNTKSLVYTGVKYSSPLLRWYKKEFWIKNFFIKTPINYVNYTQLNSPYKSRFIVQKGIVYSTKGLVLTESLSYNSSLQILTKSIKSFIWRNSGINIISQVLQKNRYPHKLKSQFKKKLFSFIYPGQSKRNVLVRRKKQVLTRLLSKSTNLVSSLDKFSYKLFYQLFTVNQFTVKKGQMFQKGHNQQTLTYSDNLRNVYYPFDYNTKGIDVGDLYIHSEVRIPRVRFKPGYQRIWREVRSALKVSLNVKFQYQQQLTKYLVKFYHLSSQYLLTYSESTLDKIIVYSQLLPDVSTTELFSSYGFIYLNGRVNTTINTVLIKNDFLQLVVSLWYYMITRWFLNWTNLRIRKFKRLVYRKNKPLQYRIMKNKKQQSYYTPNWIYQTRYDNTDVKPYLEVDFFTLSTFILTDTYIQYYHKVDDMPDLRNSTYILYNWKYIT